MQPVLLNIKNKEVLTFNEAKKTKKYIFMPA